LEGEEAQSAALACIQKAQKDFCGAVAFKNYWYFYNNRVHALVSAPS